MSLLNDLNPDQRRAAQAGGGPVMIVAGPGTGKTKTLVARIGYLVTEEHVQPEQILALTFTNKAAQEVAERAASTLSMQARARITTFHGLCFKFLQTRRGEQLRIIDDAERFTIVSALRRQAALKSISTREIAARISLAKGSLNPQPDEAITGLAERYDAELQTQNLCDFDDLLRDVYNTIKNEADFRTGLQKRFSHILVDEFQDTSELQYELLRLLNRTDNLFIIGDPLQAIYGFRGAGADMFARFADDFPAYERIELRTNYRSRPEIVALFNAIFPHATQLLPYHTESGQARTVEVLHEYGEAAFIINEIEQTMGGTDFLRSHQANRDTVTPLARFRDFAVLYRTHAVAKVLKLKFGECGIPFQIAGDGSPYESPLAQAIISIMHLLTDTNQVNMQCTLRASLLKSVSDTQLQTLLKKLDKRQKPSELAVTIAETFGLIDDTEANRHSLQQLTSSFVRFDDLGLAACVARLDELAAQNFYDERADAVALLTIHASKGLEFERVFLLAAEDGILPRLPKKPRPAVSPAYLDEERRLFYVAVTRAKSQLDVLHARKRGGRPCKISPFLASLPDTTLPRTTDPALAAQARAARKRYYKRAQSSLFD